MITILYVIIGLLIYDLSKQLVSNLSIRVYWVNSFDWEEMIPHPEGPVYSDIPTGRKFKTTVIGTIYLSYKTFRRTYTLYETRKLVNQQTEKNGS